MDAGLEAIRRIVRVGWRPPLLRLYDATETARQFSAWVPGDGCLLLVLSEGPEALVAAELAACAAEAEAGGGRPCGPEPVAHWLAERNTVPSWEVFLAQGIVVDTIEVAATWDRVAQLYETVLASLRQVPGMLAASAHSSHSYPQGTNLYITFAIRPAALADAEAVYLDAWGRTMDATLAAGGAISHHHGIGRLRVPWVAAALGTAHPLLTALKRALDPAGLLNPGALVGPDGGAFSP